MTDAQRLPDPSPLIPLLPRGSALIARFFQPRDQQTDIKIWQTLCRRNGIFFLLANDAPLATRLGCDGIHLSEAALKRRPPPRGRFRLRTGAAHNLAAAKRARKIGLDAAILSPVFVTGSHPGARRLGPLRLARLARQAKIPAYALGGIKPDNVGRMRATKLAGIALVSGFGGPTAGPHRQIRYGWIASNSR